MAKINVNLKIEVETSPLLKRIEAMGKYIDDHPLGVPCPFVDLAMEIGDIDAKADVSWQVKKGGDRCCLEAVPKGNLARLLAAFDEVKRDSPA